MDSFYLLNSDIRKYIYDQGWKDLTKIQKASIKYVSQTDKNFILAAPTASGKTEAGFLPAINSVENWSTGLKIIYISPLKALINDQFNRVNELCEYLNIKVTSWHGEASVSKKQKLLKKPEGILLITPESIEAMLLRPGEAQLLFSGVEWIIVDEIHSFLTSNRGIQLKSLLERIQAYMIKTPRYIGMSATLHKDDFPWLKTFFNNGRITNILLDKSKNELTTTLDYFPENIMGGSIESVSKIYDFSQKESMLVFPNSRFSVEYVTVNLARLAKKNNSPIRYFAHHANVSKELRLFAETFAKTASRGELFTICCTSTLELGIDIGSVDSIVQYNAPYSVSSLSQRLGRSGRKTKNSILHFIGTDELSLLQGLAAIELYQQGKLDPSDTIVKPYDVLAHQFLAILLEKSGLPVEKVFDRFASQQTWSWITREEFNELFDYLLDENYIEILENEVITGVNAEHLLTRGEFYAQFTTEDNFLVINDNDTKIGTIPINDFVQKDINIFLGGKIWKITHIDMIGKKVHVIKANDGNPPMYPSIDGYVSHDIRQKMKEIIQRNEYSYLDSMTNNLDAITEALFFIKGERVYQNNPYIIANQERVGFCTYAGDKINVTLRFLMLIITGKEFYLHKREACLYCMDEGFSLETIVNEILTTEWTESLLIDYFNEHPELIDKYIGSMKYGELLPKNLKINYIIVNNFAIEDTLAYLHKIRKELISK